MSRIGRQQIIVLFLIFFLFDLTLALTHPLTLPLISPPLPIKDAIGIKDGWALRVPSMLTFRDLWSRARLIANIRENRASNDNRDMRPNLFENVEGVHGRGGGSRVIEDAPDLGRACGMGQCLGKGFEVLIRVGREIDLRRAVKPVVYELVTTAGLRGFPGPPQGRWRPEPRDTLS